ncbi:response regulator transcription factor [Nocardioides rubriscoriae]|uniref:response regulator transcription factor n=1 Tax=Nocardioides rubriscoriae TaxID=642762 RepID=UPI0011E05395|nr:response regulator transcription factor [Nocardioides rubriscoriae]
MTVTTRPTVGPHRDLRLLTRVRRHVLLVGVSDVVAAGLTAVLQARHELGLETCETQREAGRADLVVVDVVTAASSGGITSLVRAPGRGVGVLALYPEARPDLARQALARGADGLISSAWAADRVVSTVVDALEGRFHRPASLTREVAAGPRGSQEAHGVDLSPRELAVLCRIAAGLSNEEIATELFVSINTVKTYIRSTYRRIDVRTRPQAMVWFFGHGLGDCLPSAARTHGPEGVDRAYRS